ncbi:HNH endonuclease signature motif containing protein [Arthrobacter sp. Alg241-R88]|uniref:HNH endonuclease signature motif containing protein n=1 Tax=Arthrobacter sp. Alg241-R88 TaxID=2305984 RepID=UPI0013D10A1F|nr:HNH endonuclease signature motif containing protein [Arthrobacter sp. Alg241-R88]
MEANGEQLAEYGGSTSVLTRAGSISSRGSKAFDGDPGLGFAGPLRAVPGPVEADAAEPLPAAGHASEILPSDGPPSPDQPLVAESLPADNPSGVDAPFAAAPLPTDNPYCPQVPLGLEEIGRLLAAAAAAAPTILAAADYVEAADYAGKVEDLSRSVEYLQVLAAGTVDRTRTQAIAAADAARASRSRTGKGWVTGWDNGVEILNETDTAWPGDSAPNSSPASGSAANGSLASVSAVRDSRTQIESDSSPARVVTSPADDGCANTAEFLRQRLRIGKSEAHRRLALAADILPTTTLTGDTVPATREHLAAALTPTPAAATASNLQDTTDTENTAEDTATISQATTGPVVSSRAGTIIAMTLNRLGHLVTPERLELIEENLTTTAATADPDFLVRVARRWADTIDADGTEPSEEALRHTQGAFIRKPRHGLHHIEIFATTDQYEHLLTVMNTATNPRTTPPTTSAHAGTGTGTDAGAAAGDGPGNGAGTDQDSWRDGDVDLDRRTRPQKQLEGIIGAVKTALATNTLPATGGNRPQIIATINYQDLLPHHTRPSGTAPGTGTGNFAFTGPVAAATIRKIACDADIIPALLGTHGEILDLGRKTRLFTPAQRQALNARDQGCTFPNCTVPAPWCEAHHITYWSRGGPTSTDNGALLCSGHHHLIHKEQWTITIINNTPWYTPPKHLDPHQKPQQNTYFKPPPPPRPRE